MNVYVYIYIVVIIILYTYVRMMMIMTMMTMMTMMMMTTMTTTTLMMMYGPQAADEGHVHYQHVCFQPFSLTSSHIRRGKNLVVAICLVEIRCR